MPGNFAWDVGLCFFNTELPGDQGHGGNRISRRVFDNSSYALQFSVLVFLLNHIEGRNGFNVAKRQHVHQLGKNPDTIAGKGIKLHGQLDQRQVWNPARIEKFFYGGRPFKNIHLILHFIPFLGVANPVPSTNILVSVTGLTRFTANEIAYDAMGPAVVRACCFSYGERENIGNFLSGLNIEFVITAYVELSRYE